jgi:hypothetical protein
VFTVPAGSARRREVLRRMRDATRAGHVAKALSEALEQQTATTEILQAIRRSRTDIQQVFETIVRNAVRLCDGFFGIAFRYDGHELSIVAHHEFSPRAIEVIARSYPLPPAPRRWPDAPSCVAK